MTIFEAFVTLTAKEEETMIFSKYVEWCISERGADTLAYLQLAPAETGIVQADPETYREDRRSDCAEHNARDVV